MPPKEEIISSIEERKYSAPEVRHLVNSVKVTGNPQGEPAKVKIGDVFIHDFGLKRRPLAVISVRETDNIVIAVPLTTTEDELALYAYTSRFFKSGWFTNQLVTARLSDAKENFAGVLDNPTAIKEVKKELKKFYKGLLV